MTGQYWEAFAGSPIAKLAAESDHQWSREQPAVRVGEVRWMTTPFGDQITAIVSQEGMSLELGLRRDSLRNSNHDDSIETLSAFLLSHPTSLPSGWALACAVGSVSAAECSLWPCPEDRGGLVAIAEEPLEEALDVIRGRTGHFSVDPSLSLTNTGEHRLSVALTDARAFGYHGPGGPPRLSFPWGVEVRDHDGAAQAPSLTPADQARRTVARFCIGELTQEKLEAKLEALNDDGLPALATWMRQARAACEESRSAGLGPARLRCRLAALLDQGTKRVWPSTFEERTRALPPRLARVLLHGLPSSHPDDPDVAAMNAIARWLIGELGLEALRHELEPLGSGTARSVKLIQGYEAGEVTVEELHSELWNELLRLHPWR